MIRILILLLTSGAWAAPLKNDDQKKDKRHLVGAFGVSSYNLPYRFAGYPYELFGYPFGFGSRVFGAPLSDSRVFAYPFGLEYGNPVYGINSGHIGSNALALAAYAYPAGLVSDISAISSIMNLEHGKTVEVPSSQPAQPQSPTKPTAPTTPKPTLLSTTSYPSISLIEKTGVSGGVESLKNELQFS